MDGMEITQFTYFQQVDLTKEYALFHDFCSKSHGDHTAVWCAYLGCAKNAN